MLNLTFNNGTPPALNARNMNAIVEYINTMQTQLANPFIYKGVKATVSGLPSTGNVINDTWYVTENGCLYSWTGEAWEQSSLSESEYLEQLQNLRDDITVRAPYCEDEYGSIFENQNQLYLHKEKYKDSPEYVFNFSDISHSRYATGGTIVDNGVSNINHPIKYHDSMVLVVNKFLRDTDTNLSINFVTISDGELTYVSQVIYNIAADHKKMLNLRRLKTWDTEEIYIVFSSSINDDSILTDWMEVRRSSLENTRCSPVMFMKNYNVDDFHTNDRLITYFSSRKFNIRGGWEYLYAYGIPIDAEFYDYKGTVIQQSKNGLGPFDSTKYYDTCVKIPSEAFSAKFAIYGTVVFASSYYSLSAYLGEIYYKCGAYGKQLRTAGSGLYVGRAIENALTLINCRYKAKHTAMRHYIVNSNTGNNVYQTGFPYGPRAINSQYSYYSVMSMMRMGSGYDLAARPRSYNYVFGFMCVSFISEILGIAMPYQSTEWWIQNYHDKFEEVDLDTRLEVGDITVHHLYKRSKNTGKYILSSHVALVADVLSDPETGRFGGYRVLESNNCWLQISTYSNAGLMHIVTDEERTDDPGIVSKTWRLRLPITNVPVLGQNYKFKIDKELDPVNNPNNITFPKIISAGGDMSLIGPIRESGEYKWYRTQTGTTLYAELNVDSVSVYKDDVYVGTVDEYSQSIYSRTFDVGEFIDENSENVYKFYPNGGGLPCTLFHPYYPYATSDVNGKTCTIEGAYEETDENGNLVVRLQSFDRLYFRVIPFPVDSVCGYTPRFANYINVPAEELWNGSYFDVGDNYNYIVAVTAVNTEYGGASLYFRGDHDLDIPDEDPDDGQDNENTNDV